LSNIFTGINWLDIIFLLILLGKIYKGSRSGVGGQLLSLIWWIALIFLSLQYYKFIAGKFLGFLMPQWSFPISFFAICFVLGFVIKLLERLFSIQGAENLAPIERIGGSSIAAVRCLLFFGVISIQLLLLPIPGLQNSVQSSKTGLFFMNIDLGIYSWMTKRVDFIDDRDMNGLKVELLGDENED